MKYQNIAVLSFLLLLGLSVYFFLVQPMTHPVAAAVAGKAPSSQLEYGVEKPVNGVLKGVIEIGSTGFNSFVIHIDKQKRWEVLAKNFGVSLVYEGMATPESMRQGIQRYMSSMFDNAVLKKDVHIVISSAAQKAPKAWEIMNELTRMGHRIVAVSPAEEAKFGFLATVPPSMRSSSFFVDVGSGNTKLAWQEGDSIRSFEAPGSKYFGSGTKDEAVYNLINNQAVYIPETLRQKAFIIGGAPFMLAEKIRNGQERYTVLKDPSYYKATNQRMAAGVNIYKALADITRARQFVFDWDANFSIGYLLSLP